MPYYPDYYGGTAWTPQESSHTTQEQSSYTEIPEDGNEDLDDPYAYIHEIAMAP